MQKKRKKSSSSCIPPHAWPLVLFRSHLMLFNIMKTFWTFCFLLHLTTQNRCFWLRDHVDDVLAEPPAVVSTALWGGWGLFKKWPPPSSWFLFNYSLATQSGCRQLGWQPWLQSHSLRHPQCTTPRLRHLKSSNIQFDVFLCWHYGFCSRPFNRFATVVLASRDDTVNCWASQLKSWSQTLQFEVLCNFKNKVI